MAELSDPMKDAIYESARAAHAEARAKHADEPHQLAVIETTTRMLAELYESAYEAGAHNPMLAVAWDEALTAAMGHCSAQVITEGGELDGYMEQHSVLIGLSKLENPYG